MIKKGLEWFRENYCQKCPGEDHCLDNVRNCIEAENLRIRVVGWKEIMKEEES